MLDIGLTYVVELTPAGRAAVAVVLVAGPQAVRVVEECVTAASQRRLASLPLGWVVLCRWGGAEGEEVVVCRRSEDRIEIHGHGGSAAVRAVVDRLVERGCRPLPWRDWLRRSEDDPQGAAAQIALADATTTRTAAVLLDQYHGALTAAIRRAIVAAAADWRQAAEVLDEVLRFRDVGLHLIEPWRVVLAGPPNVGKSSLLNAMAGYQRAIVSPLPGTTRDVVTLLTAIDGWPVQLADTAGLRAGQDELESAGVALAAAQLAAADLAIVVRDATDETGDLGRSEYYFAAKTVSELPQSARVIHVRNKIDLVDAADRGDSCRVGAVATSAITGQGIADLIAAIGQSLVPIAPPAGAAVPFAGEQLAALAAARAAINERDAPAAKTALQALLADEGMKDKR